VDLCAAVQQGCDRALLAWAAASLAQWQEQLGGAEARLQLLDAFDPFLDDRRPRGEALPVLTPAWVGRGNLLQASPATLAAWLQDPGQLDVLTKLQRYGRGASGDLKFLAGLEGWWILAATAAGDGPSGSRVWVVAGRGDLLVVLRLPAGQGEAEGVARLKAILDQK
jgi:hypothetical protein